VPGERIVVIGSGPAGAAAARELVAQGLAVTMLESGLAFQPGMLLRLGGRNLFRRTPELGEDAGHLVTGDPQTRCYVKHAPGGLSNNWTGAALRFAPEDFTEGERLHERYRWPVDYADMVPWYEKVERVMQLSAGRQDVPQLPAGLARHECHLPRDWEPLRRAAAAHGQGFTSYPLADGPPNLLVRRGTAFNSFTAMVAPLLRTPGFRLVTGAHALQLEWSASRGRIDAVLYHDRRNGSTQRIAARAVVVACGPLGSTKLLHNSACAAHPQGLGNQQGLLGLYLHDHPREWWQFEMARPLQLLAPPAYLTRLPHDSSAPLMATSWTLGTAGTADRIRSRFALKSAAVGVQMIGTMIPDASCHARPSADRKDEFGLPALEVCIRYTRAEVDNVMRARQHLMQLLLEAGCRASLGPVSPTLHPGTIAHYGGSVRMHASELHGVLDAWNRVRGAPNVLVCDAACFTTAAEKNPTLTLMALATRAAARLAEDLRRG
jgi:choline dehydrogenase-like flavoprotein